MSAEPCMPFLMFEGPIAIHTLAPGGDHRSAFNAATASAGDAEGKVLTCLPWPKSIAAARTTFGNVALASPPSPLGKSRFRQRDPGWMKPGSHHALSSVGNAPISSECRVP